MKRLFLTTAIAAATATAVYAEGHGNMFRTEAAPLEIHASEFIGKRVYASEAALEGDAYNGVQDNWEDIGEINDVILSRDGKIEAVMVDIGGFLGIGERKVAVNMGEIRFVADDATPEDEDDYFLVMNAARAQFEEAPEYSWSREVETAAPATAATEQAATEKPITETAAVDTAAKMDSQSVNQVTAQTETKTEVAPATASDKAAAVGATEAAPDGFDRVMADVVTAEELTGARVYDAKDNWIGEVSQLILTDTQKIDMAVIDVGGFLGIGEKPVKLAMSEVDILRKADGNEVRVYVPMTKEQLEALPTYDN